MNIESMRCGGAPSRSLPDYSEPEITVLRASEGGAASLGASGMVFCMPEQIVSCREPGCGEQYIAQRFLDAHMVRDHAS